MKENKGRNVYFYHSLGKLFYAVAAADKVVRDQEFEQLKSCVVKYWLDLDDVEDVFNSDAAYLIEIVFDGILAFDLDSEEMYQAFLDFYREQNHFFTPDVKSLILKTAREIASSFAGVNKSELMLIARLQIELHKK